MGHERNICVTAVITAFGACHQRVLSQLGVAACTARISFSTHRYTCRTPCCPARCCCISSLPLDCTVLEALVFDTAQVAPKPCLSSIVTQGLPLLGHAGGGWRELNIISSWLEAHGFRETPR